jgi:hypothetical protein
MSKNSIIFLVVFNIIGGILGMFIVGNLYGTYEYKTACIISCGAIIISFTILFIKQLLKGKKDNAPEVDERSIILLQRYLIIVLSIFFIISCLLILGLFFMNIQQIEIGLLAVYMSINIILIALGGFIVKKILF